MKAYEKHILFLVADDDADDRLLICDAFEESAPDASVDTVADGQELLDYLRRSNDYAHLKGAPLPVVVLLDLNMPRMDGRTALKAIKEDPQLRLIPVIILTTSKAAEDITRLYRLGASSFITKPLSYDKLCDFVSLLSRYWSGHAALPPGAVHG